MLLQHRLTSLDCLPIHGTDKSSSSLTMSPSWFISLLFSTFLAFAVVTASPFEAQELNVPDYPVGSTYLAVREALRRGELQKRGELQVNKTFSRSWDDAVILKM